MKKRYLFIALFFSVAPELAATIHTIDDITKILRYIYKNVHDDVHEQLRTGTFLRGKGQLYEKNASDILICFDIDETLLYPDQPKARDAWFNEHVARLTSSGISPEAAVKETIIEQLVAHRKSDVCLADFDATELIAALQQQGIHVLALTARSVAFVDITYRELAEIFIRFVQADDDWNRCYVLHNLPRPAYYTPGVIFCAGNDKGKTLEQFLIRLSYRPKYIIMVDDTRKHVERLELMTSRLGIAYDGFVITHKYHQRLPCVVMTDGTAPSGRRGIGAVNG
ncbi:MAG: DUF2608 domain-containing protein [Candidatus Dependentiae bacterium]|nr:DUF2608 domain-containing protein [Candidatus Dependentiae bacterium]